MCRYPSGGIEKSMTDIYSLVQSGVTGITLSVTIEDLSNFAANLIDAAKAQLLPIMVSVAEEDYLTKKEVMDKFGVCHTTLYNWAKNKYLVPVKIGRKVFYRQRDVETQILQRLKS